MTTGRSTEPRPRASWSTCAACSRTCAACCSDGMSANAEIIRAGFDAWNRGDLDEWLGFADPEIVFRPVGIFPDFSAEFSGHAGMRDFWSRLREPWDSLI